MLQISAYRLNFKLAEPISISFHTWHYSENVIIKISYNGLTGFGEAAPFKPITGDSQQDVLKYSKLISNLDVNPENDDLEKLHTLLDEKIKNYHTLKAALDFAYHDLLGKIKKVPVYKLYTEKIRTVDNTVTVFIKDSLDETANEAKRIFKKYPHLKLMKIKLKGENDLDRVKAIKSNAPKSIKFTLDANQAFKDPKKAVEDITVIGKVLGKVVLVEEPCPKGELSKLKFVKDHLEKILVFADESAATIEDAKKVVKKGAAHGINIKLQKAGGIYPAKKIAQICQQAHLKVMVGCMLEGPLSISAGVHFAVSTPNVILTDLDMDLDMPKHSLGEAKFKNGQRIPVQKFGLGVSFQKDKLKYLSQKGGLIYDQF